MLLEASTEISIAVFFDGETNACGMAASTYTESPALRVMVFILIAMKLHRSIDHVGESLTDNIHGGDGCPFGTGLHFKQHRNHQSIFQFRTEVGDVVMVFLSAGQLWVIRAVVGPSSQLTIDGR